jgi:hypothetical protein
MRFEELGQYAEIETIAIEGDQEVAKECVLSLAEKLGLEESERRSYLSMLIEKTTGSVALWPESLSRIQSCRLSQFEILTGEIS